MSPNVYLKILRTGLIASLFIVFFVFQDLLFPYITSKQLSFNVLMEVLLAIWLVFIWRYPSYRPKKSLISAGLIAYFIAILVSCFVSVDLNLSFWGDAERMLGFFHLLHFLIFYFILITVFRSWADWKKLFIVSIIIASLVSLFGVLGAHTYSTIGNTAYVSGYLIFNLFFCLLLFLRTQKAIRWLYILPALIMLWEFKAVHTSGAIIGLAFSILLLVFLIGIFHEKKNRRLIAWISLFVAAAAIILVFSQHKTAWFQNSFLKNLTPQKNTFQTRLVSWRGAAQDFKYHPLFGTGLGNYAVIFDKHFDSEFFNYSKTETYFDRAHNNLIDIVSTTGLLGLITYLSIFVFVIYYLLTQMKRRGWRLGTGDEAGKKNLEVVVLIALLSAYFIQNLAVFDSLVTYIGLMITLAYIYWLINEGSIASVEDLEDSYPKRGKLEITALIILLAAALWFINQYNLKPWRMFQGVIRGYGTILQGDFLQGVEIYKEILTGTPLDHDGRVTLINLTNTNLARLSASIDEAQMKDTLDYVLGLAQKNAVESPFDSLTMMQLAQTLDTIARISYQDENKFDYYSQLSLQAMDKAIESSPGRAPLYWLKAQMLLMRGEQAAALNMIDYGISLNPNYADGYCRLAQFNLFLEKEDQIIEPLQKCLDLDGVTGISSDSLLSYGLNYYSQQKDYVRSLQLAEQLALIYGNNAGVWINLAKLYTIVGNFDKAEQAAQYAIAIDSDLSKEWAEFLEAFDAAISEPSTSTETVVSE